MTKAMFAVNRFFVPRKIISAEEEADQITASPLTGRGYRSGPGAGCIAVGYSVVEVEAGLRREGRGLDALALRAARAASDMVFFLPLPRREAGEISPPQCGHLVMLPPLCHVDASAAGYGGCAAAEFLADRLEHLAIPETEARIRLPENRLAEHFF